MDSILSCWMIFGLLGAGHMAREVKQTPRHKITEMGQAVTLRCDPISGQQYIYWYRQTADKGMEFMAYLVDKTPTDKADFFRDRFSAEKPEGSYSNLKIDPVQLGDSAMYLCASSEARGSSYNSPLYFGTGTRLTVTENLDRVKPPNVAVFEPSEAEINQKKKATLVCLATGFYPDHVELSWWVNGKETRSGVSTDPHPYEESPGNPNSSYCLSSRLRVSAAFWHNPRNHFRCQVQFYGLTDDDPWDQKHGTKPVTQNISAGVWGRADCGFTSVSYQQGILSATLLYEILLGKATLYAVLVSALVLITMVKKKHS